MQLTCDFSGLAPDVAQGIVRGLQHEDRARYVLGVFEQLRLKKLADEIAKAKYRGELRPSLVISTDQWKRAMNDYGQLCWSDPDFAPWLKKRDEGRDMAVRDPGEKTMSGWRRPDPKHQLRGQRMKGANG